MIEFGQLMSDMPSFQNRGSMKVDNVIPLAKGYKSFPSFTELTTGFTNAQYELCFGDSFTWTPNGDFIPHADENIPGTITGGVVNTPGNALTVVIAAGGSTITTNANLEVAAA